MADTKITALTALTAADPANDVIPIVDVSDTSMAASGTTKKISVNNILSSSPTASGALTVTGLVTAGSASITGALTVDTTTLVVDAANDMVGVGTAPIYKFHAVATSGAVGAFRASTAAIARLLVGNTVGDLEIKVNANSDGQITSDVGKYLGLGSNTSNDRVILDTSGNLSITNGNLVMSTSGKGIDFSATAPDGTGTVTDELLDDYEEGTWTPTVTASSGTITTSTVTSANYTKIGRVVSVNFDVRIDVFGGATGILIVSLPFSASGAETCGAGKELINTGNMCQVFRQSSTGVGVLFYNNLTVIANTNRVVCSYTYFV